MTRLSPFGLLLLIGACAVSSRHPLGVGPELLPPPAPIYLNPDSVPVLAGFSHAVKVGSTVYISGEVALDSAGAIVGAGDLARQTDRALDNLEAVVRAARGLPADVVKLSIYVVGYTPADFAVVRDAVIRHMPAGQLPAITLVGVAALPMAGLLISVDGIAVLHSALPDRERDVRPAR